MWVPFNEGWGQFDTPRIAEWIKKYDPTPAGQQRQRLDRSPRSATCTTSTSIPGPGAPKPEAKRAAVLGEFGGLGLPLAGHTWQSKTNWGYRGLHDAGRADRRLRRPARRGCTRCIGTAGLSAAVYTQTTDVEIEVNGLMTYDRAVIKLDAARVRAANLALFTPPPVVKPIVADIARQAPQTWRYTIDEAGRALVHARRSTTRRGRRGRAASARRSTPGAVVRTEWKTADIWLRRTFELPAMLTPRESAARSCTTTRTPRSTSTACWR